MQLRDLPGQPQCGLRLLEPVKSSLSLRGPRRVKRTHIANQMKRVQGDESPWRSLGRPQCGFHIQPQRTPGGILSTQQIIAREAPTQRGASFRISEPRSHSGWDRHKETHSPEVNP